MSSSLVEIAALIHAELIGNDAKILGVAPLEEAGPTDLSLCVDARRARELAHTKAAGVLLPPRFRTLVSTASCSVILCSDPRMALARILEALYPQAQLPGGILPGSFVDPQANVDPTARIEPGARIEAQASVGARTIVRSGGFVGTEAQLGQDCVIGPNAVVGAGCRLGNRVVLGPGAVVGSPGFGFVFDGSKHIRIPQRGCVILEDDVEIGSNTTVDRATLGATKIGAGTKIDNLVQIGHNVNIGKNVLIAAQVGLSGSVKVGDEVMMGGQAGVADRITIGNRAQLAAKSGVGNHVPEGTRVAGYPAEPIQQWLEKIVLWSRIRKFLKAKGREGETR